MLLSNGSFLYGRKLFVCLLFVFKMYFIMCCRYSGVFWRAFSLLAVVSVFHVRKDLHRTETLELSKHELMSNYSFSIEAFPLALSFHLVDCLYN